MKIGLRFFTRGFFCLPANANLSVKFDPVKCQRRVRVGIELLSFFAFVVGKKNEPILVEAFQQHDAYGWSAISAGCSQAHCIHIADFGLDRRCKPVSKLFDRIAAEIAPAQTFSDMLVTRSIGISRRLHHNKKSAGTILRSKEIVEPGGAGPSWLFALNCRLLKFRLQRKRAAYGAVTTGVRTALCLSFSITFGTTSITRSISASVLNRPREKRRLRRAPSALGFIARSTCEASCEPVRQAEPAEQQIPCRSSKRSAAGDSMPSNARLDVFESLTAPSPLTAAPLTISSMDFSNRSRIEPILHFPSTRYFRASSAAFPRPTIDATFSVPPRRAFS